MSRKAWAIICGAILFSFLFYRQSAGINFLLFSVLLAGIYLWLKPQLLRDKGWLAIAFLTLLSGVFILLYGSSLAIFANCVSLLLLAVRSSPITFSVLTGLVHALFSLGGSIVFMILDITDVYKKSKEQESSARNFAPGIILVSLSIAFIFFFIYKSANPLFDNYTSVFNIDAGVIFFTILGVFILYGFLMCNPIKPLEQWERKQTADLVNSGGAASARELQAALILFVLLNTMLLLINGLDLNYLYLGAGMPKGISHKQFVHNGVGTLVSSILLGIIIILFFFRSALNFSEKNKAVKLLVSLWIFQNLFMVLSTAIRNKMYTDDALLTYRRIGVYYWLGMAALGLVVTFIKIQRLKTIWFLVRTNAYIAFLMLVFSAGIDWDQYITDYNLRNTGSVSSLDKRYLISLSEGNIAQLYDLEKSPGFNVDSSFHYRYNRWMPSSAVLDEKLYEFRKDYNDCWKSFSLRSRRVKKQTDELGASIDSLNFGSCHISSMKPLWMCVNLKTLKLGWCDTSVYTELLHFKKLKKLHAGSSYERNVAAIKRLKQLDTLTLSSSPDTVAVRELMREMPATKIIYIKGS
jgi:hypothetical protein